MLLAASSRAIERREGMKSSEGGAAVVAAEPPDPREVRLLKPSQVAEMLGIGRTKVYDLIASGELPVVVLSGRIKRISAAALREWIEQRTIGQQSGRTTDLVH